MLRRTLGIMIGMCVGTVVFYFAAAHAGCDWLWRDSNLCGLPAMMFAAPIGAVIGALVGRKLS